MLRNENFDLWYFMYIMMAILFFFPTSRNFSTQSRVSIPYGIVVNDLNTPHHWISLKHSCLNGAIYFTCNIQMTSEWQPHFSCISPLPTWTNTILVSYWCYPQNLSFRKSDAVCERNKWTVKWHTAQSWNTRGTYCLFILRPSTFQRKCIQFYAHVVST